MNIMSFFNLCKQCIDIHQTSTLIFGAYVAVISLASLFKNKTIRDAKQHSVQVTPASDLGNQNMFPNKLSRKFLNLLVNAVSINNFVIFFGKTTDFLNRVSFSDNKSFFKRVFYLFIAYYMIVTPFAFIMYPIKYSVNNTSYALISLFLMMLTNAFGDAISFKITLKNASKIKSYNIADRYFDVANNTEELLDSFKFEFKLYITMIRDALIALWIFVCVIVLTSVYFGSSIGEYGFADLSIVTDSYNRILYFWETINTPYRFRESIIKSNIELPMLLIFSITSFIPTLLILLTALIWTFLLPIRLVIKLNLDRKYKFSLAQATIFIFCMTYLSIREVMIY